MNWPIFSQAPQIQQFPMSVVYILLGLGVVLGIIGALAMVRARHPRGRLVGALLFSFLPAVVLFAIFPSSGASAEIDFIGKLGGPIAGYFISVFVITQLLGKLDNTDERIKKTEAQLNQAEARWEQHVQAEKERQALDPAVGASYIVNGATGQLMTLIEGNIRDLLGQPIKPDVIVNSENDYLMLGRPYDRNVSGMLRYLDAEHDKGGLMRRDALDENLRICLGDQPKPVSIGSVFVTPTVGLAQHGVSYIFHVATAKTQTGGGYHVDPALIPLCVRHCYEHTGSHTSPEKPIRSILFPLIGAGDGKASSTESADRLVSTIIQQMPLHQDIQTTYVVTYRGIDKQAVIQAAEAKGLELVEAGSIQAAANPAVGAETV